MKPAAIYARVSTDDKGQDPDQQVGLVRAMLINRGYEVPDRYVFREEVSGGKGREGRPELDRLLDCAHRGEFSAVGVWKCDRFSRDGKFTGGLLLVGELDHFNVGLISHQETYLDTSGPWRRPLVAMALQVAEQFRADLRAATTRALDQRREAAASGKGFVVTGARSKRRGQVIYGLGRERVVPLAVANIARGLRAEGTAKRRSWAEVRALLTLQGHGTFGRTSIATAVSRLSHKGGSKP
jgi:DNA invertase Pin-like site-specific DNA recombinase